MSEPKTGNSLPPESGVELTQPLRILLLEDSPTDAELNEHMLRKAGIDIVSLRVETRAAFVAALDEFRPDLILADYRLPEFDGLQALAIVLERSPDLPYIFVTGAMGDEQAAEFIKRGAADYILKDRLTRLPAAVQHALEEQHANRQLRESEERNHLIVRRMPQGCITCDVKFRVESWNPAAEGIFGFSEAEAIGKHPYDFVVPKEAQPAVDKIWERILEGDEAAHSVNENVTKDGRTIICEWINIPLKQPDGRVVGVLSMVQDITERRQAEDELQLRAQLLDSANDSIFVHDFDGNCVYLNEAAWKSRGYTRDELMGMNLHVLDTPEYEKLIESRMRELFEKGYGTFESAHRRKDGSIMPIEVSARIIESGGRKLLLGVVRDITERRQAEARLNEQLDELRRWRDATVGRELRILDVKREVNELLVQAGQPPRYPSAEPDESTG